MTVVTLLWRNYLPSCKHCSSRQLIIVYDVRLEDIQLKLRVGERELETLNWSIGGFRAHGLDDLELKDRITGKLEPQDGPSCEFTGQVTRR